MVLPWTQKIPPSFSDAKCHGTHRQVPRGFVQEDGPEANHPMASRRFPLWRQRWVVWKFRSRLEIGYKRFTKKKLTTETPIFFHQTYPNVSKASSITSWAFEEVKEQTCHTNRKLLLLRGSNGLLLGWDFLSLPTVTVWTFHLPKDPVGVISSIPCLEPTITNVKLECITFKICVWMKYNCLTNLNWGRVNRGNVQDPASV